MNKKIIVTMVLFSLLSSSVYADCASLLSQYKRVPDPSVKTMKQLKRWVKRKIKDGNKKAVEQCLVDRAADNPNKATVAGE